MTGHGTSWRRFGVLSAIAVAIASFLGWQTGYTMVQPGPALAPTRWSLPTQVAEKPDRDLAILAARRPWNNELPGTGPAVGDRTRPAAAAAGAAAALQWRLAGVVQRPDGNFALIATGHPNALKFEYRAIGDKLPDGSTLVEIAPASATIQSAGRDAERRVLRLFHGTAAAAGPAAAKLAPSPPPKRQGAASPGPGAKVHNLSASPQSRSETAQRTISLRQSVPR